ncbi:hypothetical protein EV1_019644 [Malus domestica]
MSEWGEGTLDTKDDHGREILEEEVKAAIHMAECIYNLDWLEDEPEASKSLEFLHTEPDKPAPEVQDSLEIINLGIEENPRPIQLSGLLEIVDRANVVNLLHEFKDCFAWHYMEMLGLDSCLVEHRMPIKEMSKEIEEKVKKQIKRLVKAGFIRLAKYEEWLANIVPVLKAVTNAIRCCVDYKNINEETPMDEYLMPMADLSIVAVAKHKVLSLWMEMLDIIR